MVLTVVLGVALGLFGVLGGVRGVARGLVAVAGTLLAVVLVDLWSAPIADWVRTALRPERPALPSYLFVGGGFAVTALVIGYGGAALLPRPDPAASPPSLFARILGALLGALNGALLTSYLLRYATETWVDGQADAIIRASPLGLLLLAWLPWFVLAMIVATGVYALIRAIIGQATRSSSPGSVAASRNLAEADRKLNDKIDQALGRK